MINEVKLSSHSHLSLFQHSDISCRIFSILEMLYTRDTELWGCEGGVEKRIGKEKIEDFLLSAHKFMFVKRNGFDFWSLFFEILLIQSDLATKRKH